ncbi:MAG: hypothetical protein JWM78_3739 [Verrucomicrobiaceae bacterium]|nr:hypothetical protein [Verrucomicrobiaceae bacterium]
MTATALKTVPDHSYTQGVLDDLLAQVREIRPLLRRNAPLADAARSPTDEVVSALDEIGLWALLTPTRWGGRGLPSIALQRINRELAKGDPSVAWVHQIINGCTWIASMTSDRLQEEVFTGTKPPRVCSSFAVPAPAVPVEGGYTVTGAWPYNSGVRQSSWGQYLVTIQHADGTQTPGNFVYIPTSELTIQDTWYTAGLQGTSSDSSVANNVFVPEHRMVHAAKSFGTRELGKKHFGAPSDFWKNIPLIRACGIGVILGAVEGAFELAAEGALKRGIPNTTYTKQKDSPVLQRDLGAAKAKIDAAVLLAERLCTMQDEAALSGYEFNPLERAQQKGQCALVVEMAISALEKIMFIGGSSGFSLSNELQRFWRDANVAARHAINLPDPGFEIYGRAILGVEPNIAPAILI